MKILGINLIVFLLALSNTGTVNSDNIIHFSPEPEIQFEEWMFEELVPEEEIKFEDWMFE